tara:strand:+ start:2066 stop:2512 length:447 start_codon:yes stop_codon:yes gene_type:complete
MDKQIAEAFLEGLVHKIKESDKKEISSSKPTLYFIQEDKELSAGQGFSDSSWFQHIDDCELVFDSEKELDDFLAKNSEYSKHEFEEIPKQTIRETKELAFLTRESCQEHINRNNYHYNKPRTYSRGVWRDPLMKGLFQALHALYGEKS